MKLVIIESPLKGSTRKNTLYAKLCMEDSLKRGEAPLSAHLLYPLVLEEFSPELGPKTVGDSIDAASAWKEKADLTALYTDHGITDDMRAAKKRAEAAGREVEMRMLEGA